MAQIEDKIAKIVAAEKTRLDIDQFEEARQLAAAVQRARVERMNQQ